LQTDFYSSVSISLIGTYAEDITQYSTSLDSSTSYIATINTTEVTLRGQWRIGLESQGFFTIQVLGNSELIISTHIFTNSLNGDDIDDVKPLESKVTKSFTIGYQCVCYNFRFHYVC